MINGCNTQLNLMKKDSKEGKAVFSISAYIDLLGFSSHLKLASFDLRTKTGEIAYSRLKFIEKAIELFKTEKIKYPEIYPANLHYQRFNDALILGIDVNKSILPKIGDPNITVGYSHSELMNLTKSDDGTVNKWKAGKSGEAIKVGLFIGLVSRLHMYINKQELNANMPGCRTIISSGLRFRFFDRKGDEDYYSANFSLTNAYIVNATGSENGFPGNNFYLDDNVARICWYNEFTKGLIAYSKFIPLDSLDDPYLGNENLGNKNIILISYKKYAKTKKIPIDLFRKPFTFRALNTIPISNFQLLPTLIALKEDKNRKLDSITKKMIDGIMGNPPTLKEVNDVNRIIAARNWPAYIFLTLIYSLSDDFKKTVEVMT